MTSAAPVIESEKVLVIPAKTATDPAVNEQHDSNHTPPPPADGPAGPLRPSLQPSQPKADPVIPLVHAPDDPGPEAEIVEDTKPEPDAKPSGWRKIFE
jgi:HemY protein